MKSYHKNLQTNIYIRYRMGMKLILVLENIRSVYNVGSIFRTMEGLGFSEAALVGITPTPLDPRGVKRKDFIKTALGAEDRIMWTYYQNISEVLELYNGATVIAIEEGIGGVPLHAGVKKINPNSQDTYICILGSEVDGISGEASQRANETWYIEMYGTKESFNVSVAAGIVLYELKQISTDTLAGN